MHVCIQQFLYLLRMSPTDVPFASYVIMYLQMTSHSN